jgi:cytoskeletal protein CcmA (bactofilin family)
VLKKFIPQKPPAPAETFSPAPISDNERQMPSFRDENLTPTAPSPTTLTEHQKYMAEHSGKDVLSSDVEIKGSIKFQKELLIDGKVEGEINSDGVLTIGENADIRGEIKTKSITVFGKVHGNITVGERCELKSRCTLQGDLKAARLVIEEGATFIGKSEVTSGKAPASSNGSPTRAEVSRGGTAEEASPAAKSLASRA